MVDPIASVCSTHPPVSVCGTGAESLPSGFSRDHGLTRFAQSLRPEPNPLRQGYFTPCRAALHHGDVQNPAEPPPSVAASVDSAHLRCRNVCLLRFGYACRPRLSPRLTLGGLASPRKPRVYGGRVTLSSLATHASILARARSTVGRPPASPLYRSLQSTQESKDRPGHPSGLQEPSARPLSAEIK